jgi:hypothetical protein
MAGDDAGKKGKSVLFQDQPPLDVCKPESTGSNTASSSSDDSRESMEVARVIWRKVSQLKQALKATQCGHPASRRHCQLCHHDRAPVWAPSSLLACC